MQFGVCGDVALAEVAAKASYDFAEWSVGALLKPREPESAFLEMRHLAATAKLPYPVVNCFVPGDLKITGPDVDFSGLQKYVQTTLRRAEEAGVRLIVFGSGGARKIPEGFGREDAHSQILAFCAMAAGMARQHGVTIVVEPLNRSECNVLNTVAEGAAVVREVDNPALRLLVDAYHLLRDGDSIEDVVAHGDLLAHVHIATIPNRLPPGAEACDFSPFFRALDRAGYQGRVSIEGKFPAPETDLPRALAVMQGRGTV